MLKKLLRDVATRDIHGLSPSSPASEAVTLMRSKCISCVPVLDNGRPVGMFTERNLVRLLAKGNKRFADRPISEVMTTPVHTATEDMFLYEAFHVLDSNHIRHLVVVDDDHRATGLLTLSNLMDQIGSDFFVEFQPIGQLMTGSVYTVDSEASLRGILAEMSERSISCVICADGDRPLGILTERDVVRLLAAGEDPAVLHIGEIMSVPPVTVPLDAEVVEVAKLMRDRGIRRVVVVDSRGRIAGLATQTNIVRGLETKYIRVLRQVIEEKEHRLTSTIRELDEISLYLDSILQTAIDMGIVATDTDLRVIYYNRCAEDLLGYEAEAVMGKTVSDIHGLAGVEAEGFERILDKVREEGSYTFTCMRAINGEERHFQARVSGIWDRHRLPVGYVHIIQDITERKKAEENIRFMAFHDILTGLPNRVSFNERVALELARAERKGHQMALMLIDLDRFKEVNDTWGHFAGDLLLQEISKRLVARLRKSDTLARLGGDEFVAVLPEVNGPADAELVARKLLEATEEPVDVKGQDIATRISVGIALFPDQAGDIKALLELADASMYRAKERGHANGRSNYTFAELV